MRNFVELRLLATSSESVASFFTYCVFDFIFHLSQKLGLFIARPTSSRQDFMQHNTLPKHDQKLPFTRYDFGWVLLCIGMAIGAGTVLMPVQIGLKGIWVFITAAIIAYPATWVVRDIYLKTLSESDSCNDYTDIISHYLGRLGIFLGVIYFLMIIHGIFIYSLAVVFDSASYLKTFSLTDADLSPMSLL